MVVARAIGLPGYAGARVVPRPRRRVVPSTGFRTYLMVGVCSLLLFAVNATVHGVLTVNSVRMEATTRILATTENDCQGIELEIAYLSSYTRVARDAETRLSMRAPEPGELCFVALAPPEPAMATRRMPRAETAGLVAAVGGWLQSLGRTMAATQ